MPAEHECPYRGERYLPKWETGAMGACGDMGWLCHRCREDRADKRAEMVVAALRYIAYRRGS